MGHKVISIITLLFSLSAVADSSPECQAYCDYLCRHFRSDLKPVELRLSKRNAGDFYYYTLALRIRNIGEVAIGDPNGGNRPLKIAVSGLGQKLPSIQGQIEAGQSRWVGLGRVNPGQISHCMRLKLQIDSDREFGQFGCSVHSNDKSLLTVYEAGKKPLCLRHPRFEYFD